MTPVLSDEMLLSSTSERLGFEFPEADEDHHCASCKYLSAHGTCLSGKCPHKTIKPNKETDK